MEYYNHNTHAFSGKEHIKIQNKRTETDFKHNAHCLFIS